jgi:aldose 1-epimerase
MRRFTEAELEAEALEATIGGHTTRIEVLPRLGANLVSFQVDGREFIHFDPGRLLGEEPHMTGCFHMFPTPCRLGRSRYSFEGREIVQRKRGEEVNIHGLIRDEEFAISKSDRELSGTLAFDQQHPVHEGFPFPGEVSIRYRLLERGLEVRFAYENRDDRKAPVGYGIHPFWQIPGDRAEVQVTIPCDYRMELDDPVSQLPTGKLIPVAGTKYDLRSGRSLAGLFIDDVFYPRMPAHEAAVAFSSEKLRVKIEASENMGHMICYSPEGRAFVCVENLTCAPDAQNLYARGFGDVAGLTIVAPGQGMEAWVRYRAAGG